jgi:hypothetical protein
LTVLFTALSAHAEPITELVPRLIQEGGWLEAHYPGSTGGPANKERPPSDSRSASLIRSEPVTAPPEFVGDELHVAIVARDWQAAYNLTDGRTFLFDRMRLIRSSRMAVTRFVLGGGRFVPYAEVSMGQWRPDSDLMPWIRSDVLQAATQVALGFQVHVASRCAFAWDVEQTQIFASLENVPATHVVASFAALRAEF